MAFSVSVALLSGRRAELRLPIGATVDDLRHVGAIRVLWGFAGSLGSCKGFLGFRVSG